MGNTVFPSLPGLAWGTTKKPVWNTRVQKSASGKRMAVGYMTYPIYQYTLNFNVLREFSSFTEMEQLQGFFNAHKGQLDTFLFTDPEDNAVTVAQQLGVGNGSNKNFQLVRTFGGVIEPVQSPNTAAIYKNGVLQTLGTHYSITSTGIVVFVTAPANGDIITWTGTFYWRCALTQDTIDLINQDGINIWKTGKISFETVKL